MNTLVQQTQQQGALLNTFVRNGPHYFLVQDQDYKVVEISEALPATCLMQRPMK